MRATTHFLAVFLAVTLGVTAGCVDGLELTLGQGSVDFGEVAVGTTADEPVDVVLTLGGPANFSAWIEPEGAPFVLVQQGPPVLDSELASRLIVRFQPEDGGQSLGLLALEVESVEGISRRDVSLTGQGRIGALDGDRDGFARGEDCDDTDATVYPGAPELCDGVDNDCDGLLPAAESDFDGDGVSTCEGDCADDDPTTAPGQPELCDGVDNDCDGDLGESDEDSDGWRLCDGDCDDGEASVHPTAPELCDGLDTDCDGTTPEEESDADGDGWRPCGGDCLDEDENVFPGAAEACDGLDSDCDGELPDAEVDADGDGFLACNDCNDDRPEVYPGATEACDGVDTDCDGVLPPDELDGDGDGVAGCADCDDSDPAVAPGLPEACDGVDTDCDGSLPADELDLDADSFLACEECDDGNGSVNPDAEELCDGLDTDCDGLLPGNEVDGDGDGELGCVDCDDGDVTVFPGAPELCDGLDNDCDDIVPDDELDEDLDGYQGCDGDCDDSDPAVNEGAEEECFDAVDTDCDGTINQDCDCPIWGSNTVTSVCVSYGTYTCPWPQAQLAISASQVDSSCDEVWLQVGTYFETVEINGEVLLRGPGDPAEVVIDGGGSGTALSVEPGSVVTVQHLTLTGGEAAEGGGLFAEDSELELYDLVVEGNSCGVDGFGGGAFFEGVELEVHEVLFEGNDCGYGGLDDGNDGGGIYAVGCSGTVGHSVFSDNLAGDGSAFFMEDNSDFLTVLNNTFVSNSTFDLENPLGEIEGGALVVDSDSTIVGNNLFGGNDASAGGGAITVAGQGSGTIVLNNLLLDNSSSQGAGIHFEFFSGLGSSGIYQNNIIAWGDGWGVWTDGGFLPPSWGYTDVYDNTAGAYGSPTGLVLAPLTDFAQDPDFVAFSADGDWTNDDYALDTGSVCIDAGHPSPVYNDVDGTRNDLGIFGGPLGDWSGP